MEIRAESRLEEIDGRRLVFSVKAYDETGTIGEGNPRAVYRTKRKIYVESGSEEKVTLMTEYLKLKKIKLRQLL